MMKSSKSNIRSNASSGECFDITDNQCDGTKTRIPKTLQAVFLASNRGGEINRPPPKKVAFKTFVRQCIGVRSGSKNLVDPSTATAASIEASYKKGCKKTETKTTTSSTTTPPKINNPQTHLDDLMRSRGYCTKKYSTLKTAYRNKPTALQNASYDLHLIGIVKSGGLDDLTEILQSGISPNPCNVYGESLVHMVCRRGDQKKLQIMIQNGCDIQVADDYGRTPLHDACWAADPAFEAVEMLLDHDLTLLQMTDCRGFLPLSYVRKDHWGAWIQYIDSKKDAYWPKISSQRSDDVVSTVSTVCEFVEQEPDTRPLPDPLNALPLDLANMVASGKIKPAQAMQMRNRRMVTSSKNLHDLTVVEGDEVENDDENTECNEGDSDYDSDSEDDDEYDEDDDFTEDEMNELMETLTVKLGGAALQPLSASTLKQ